MCHRTFLGILPGVDIVVNVKNIFFLKEILPAVMCFDEVMLES